MRKILLLTAAVCLIVTGTALAGGSTNTGCGLGSLLWSELGHSGSGQVLVIQVFEATTNGTFGSQTFGITTGTSNCDRPSRFVKNDAFEFATANLDNLAKDIAMGKGETLSTFAELMDIPAAQRVQVYTKLQANFSHIFSSPNIEAGKVVDNIVTVINS